MTPPSPDLLLRGRARARAGDYREALEDFEQLWRQEPGADPAVALRQRAELLTSAAELGTLHPPARQALDAWRDQVEERQVRGDDRPYDLITFLSLCHHTERPAAVIEVVERLVEHQRHHDLDGLEHLLATLAAAERWDLVDALVEDADAWFHALLDEAGLDVQALGDLDSLLDVSLEQAFAQMWGTTCGWVLRAKIRAGRREQVQQMLDSIARTTIASLIASSEQILEEERQRQDQGWVAELSVLTIDID